MGVDDEGPVVRGTGQALGGRAAHDVGPDRPLRGGHPQRMMMTKGDRRVGRPPLTPSPLTAALTPCHTRWFEGAHAGGSGFPPVTEGSPRRGGWSPPESWERRRLMSTGGYLMPLLVTSAAAGPAAAPAGADADASTAAAIDAATAGNATDAAAAAAAPAVATGR